MSIASIEPASYTDVQAGVDSPKTAAETYVEDNREAFVEAVEEVGYAVNINVVDRNPDGPVESFSFNGDEVQE